MRCNCHGFVRADPWRTLYCFYLIVPPLGLEPRTRWLRVSYSSQLSYGGVCLWCHWSDSNRQHDATPKIADFSSLPTVALFYYIVFLIEMFFIKLCLLFVDPGGLEPPLSEPESDVLATTLWVNIKNLHTWFASVLMPNKPTSTFYGSVHCRQVPAEPPNRISFQKVHDTFLIGSVTTTSVLCSSGGIRTHRTLHFEWSGYSSSPTEPLIIYYVFSSIF